MISGWLMRTGECGLSESKGRKLKNNLCYFKSFVWEEDKEQKMW